MPSNNYTTQIKVEMVCHGTLNPEPEVRQRKHISLWPKEHIYTKKERLCRLKATVNRSITSSHVCKQKSWFTGSRGAKNRIDLVEDRESVFFSLPLLNEAFFKSLKSVQFLKKKYMKYIS